MIGNDLCAQIAGYLSAEVDCFDAPDGMVGCNLPLTYPTGDAVTVYVGETNGGWEITDRAEAYMSVLDRYTPDIRDFSRRAQYICESLGVVFADGRVVVNSKEEMVPDVWAVGLAASRIAAAVSFYRPRKQREAIAAQLEETFTEVVVGTLSAERVEVGRDVQVVGASGHSYTATVYVPAVEAVIEPLAGSPPFPHVSATYAKFGDIGRANGYRRYAVVDDRQDDLDPDITRLLEQVGEVVEWSDRSDWLLSLSR